MRENTLGMTIEPNRKDRGEQKDDTGDTLIIAAGVLGCLALYFLLDWVWGWLFESLPDGIQMTLGLVGILLTVFAWIGRAFDWMEKDLKKIEEKERAAKERDSK